MIYRSSAIVIQIVFIVQCCVSCKWPQVDALFIIDSTTNVGETNHELIKKFALAVAGHMQIGFRQTRVSVAQYTPKADYLLNLFSGVSPARKAKYSPCLNENYRGCQPHASINSIARNELTEDSGDRKDVPDAVIVISSTTLRIPETRGHEVLLEPISPIHLFYVIVGTLDDYATNAVNYAAAATTLKFSAINYTILPELVEALCLSSNDFIGRNKEEESSVSTASISIIIALVLIFLLFLGLLSYAVYSFKRENAELRSTLNAVEQRYRRALELSKMESSINPQDGSIGGNGEHDTQLQQQSSDSEHALLKHYDRRLGEVVPIFQDNSVVTSEPIAGNDNGTDVAVVPGTIIREQNLDGAEAYERNAARSVVYDSSASKGEETKTTKNNESSESESDTGPIPAKNPSKTLPPVDLLLLVDASSSIGNVFFEHMKRYVIAVLENIDIMPGRSRIAAIEYASEPTVYFDFNKFYSQRAVNGTSTMQFMHKSPAIVRNREILRHPISAADWNLYSVPGNGQIGKEIVFPKYSHEDSSHKKCQIFSDTLLKCLLRGYAAIKRMPYLGGPTFLAKALTFASGVLYQEQNMKSGRHRKHNLMPTPRHDRPQLMIVVTDGYSEDNFDRAANILHDKMNVKIAAMVRRIYNKEKLLPLTRYEGAVFRRDQTEALSIWIWRQQRTWNENYGSYIEKEKASPLGDK